MRNAAVLLKRWIFLVLTAPIVALAYLWPWHPHTKLGWCLLLTLGLPGLLVVECFGDRALFGNPLAARLDAAGKGAGPSSLRIAYGVVAFLLIGGLGLLAVVWLKHNGWWGAWGAL